VPGTEVDRGCRSGVGHVLWVLDSITIGVDAHDAPGAGDELHRSLGPGEAAAPVERVAAGVGDEGSTVQTIQRDAVNGGLVHTGRVQLAATKAPMVALDPSDGRQQCPVDMASRVG
jgi:hypothetical protein